MPRMPLFRRRHRGIRTVPVPGRPDLLASPTEDLASTLSGLAVAVMELLEAQPPPREVLRRLAAGLPYLTQREHSRDGLLAGRAAAQLGYLARVVEYDRFAASRTPDLDFMTAFRTYVADEHSDDDVSLAMLEFAAQLVRSEPSRPSHGRDAALWTIPGIGGDLRLALADRLLAAIGREGPDGSMTLPEDVSKRDLLLAWKYGFYLRVLAEIFDTDPR